MKRRLGWVSLLLLGSGGCALVYQTVWLRQFRLIFGTSTAASAAVLAIFLGGLGLGGHLIGRRIDRAENPLRLYGYLECGVALSVLLSAVLLPLAREVYLWTGGSFGLGTFIGTIVRLLLSVLVLSLPTILMGGTLPAAARAVEHAGDRRRAGVSILYATNTFGGVLGTLVSTFYMLERLGNLRTLVVAALANSILGVWAIVYSSFAQPTEDAPPRGIGERGAPTVSPRIVFAAAAAVGFVFLLMELVWYRMLTPLLGGTTFTFGLILATALAGVGAGSLAYALMRQRPTVGAFAIVCALEALFIAIPLALGDRIAFAALHFRPSGSIGLAGYMIGWSAVIALVVLPASCVAGFQFPLLVSLLGEGREEVGRHVGTAYLWNTAGAIAGSIAGGFGALPLLTAPGTWRAAVIVLVVIVIAALFLAWERPLRIAAGIVITIAIVMLFATGPTAFWRHSPIGAGRVVVTSPTRNRLLDFAQLRRRASLWETDGIESSVSVSGADGYSFTINGKSDGHARLDAGTQIAMGILPALLHPNPRRAAVIGLGTGSTAGWLAAIPTIVRVDTIEIEPAIVHVAEMCAPVNRDVLHNPKAHLMIGDAREFLLTSGEGFDIISSEPSNPYRAGIASLFTAEFYRACASRLNRGGLFVQFVQAYEVDAPTIHTIFATMRSVFPEVETWQTTATDLVMVASMGPIAHQNAAIGRRLQAEPYRSAMRYAWGVNDVAGVLARYVCGNTTASRLATGARINTDDRTIVEYAFARTLGVTGSFSVAELRSFARDGGDDFPASMDGSPAAEIESARLSIGVAHESPIDLHSGLPADLLARGVAQSRYVDGVSADASEIWSHQTIPPRTPLEMISLGESLADQGDDDAMPYIDAVRGEFPIEADVLLARLRWRQKRGEGAAILAGALIRYRRDPWPLPLVMRHALGLASDIAKHPQFPENGRPLYEALREPFALEMLNEQRKVALLFAAERLSGGKCTTDVVDVIRSYEPHVPWQLPFLTRRARCYAGAGDPGTAKAERDLRDYQAHEAGTLSR